MTLHARFTMAPLNALSHQIWIRYAGFRLFKLLGFILGLLLVNNNVENTFRVIFNIFDEIKVSRILLYCMEGSLHYVYSPIREHYQILPRNNLDCSCVNCGGVTPSPTIEPMLPVSIFKG